MANSSGQGIGDIQRRRRYIHLEKEGHHLLYLHFLGPAVSDDGALDLRRRVLGNRYVGLRCCEHQHTAYVPERQGATSVLGVEKILDGDSFGLVTGQEVGEAAMDET